MGDLTRTKWEIFNNYASRIHSVVKSSYGIGKFPASSLLFCAALSPHRPIFPNLRHIDWWHKEEQFETCLPFFLVPTVETVVFACEPWGGRAARAAVTALQYVAGAPLPRLWKFHCSLHGFDHPIVPHAAAACLRSHPTVTSFAFIAKPMAETLFKALQVLSSITTVSVRCPDKSDDMYNYLTQLASTCPLLRTVAIQRFKPRQNWLDLLQPLFDLPLLSLKVLCESKMVLHRSDIHRLATVWPTLNHLELRQYFGPELRRNGEQGTPLAILASFPTVFLSKIRHLALDISFERPIPAIPSQGQNFHALRCLDVSGWGVSDSNITPVGQLLGQLCPCGVFPTVPEGPHETACLMGLGDSWDQALKNWKRVYRVMEEVHQHRVRNEVS